METVTLGLAGAGVLAVTFVGYKVLKTTWKFLRTYVFGCRKNLKKLAGAGADWAVVTGSTDGIGKAYAHELAKKGFNLILISRTQSKLDATAEEIGNTYVNIQVRTVAFDFSTGNVQEYYEKLFPVLDKYEIGVLVNNVGATYAYPDVMHAVPGGATSVVNSSLTNIVPAAALTTYALQKMSLRHSGVVVNVSSGIGTYPLREWAAYAASKAYICYLGDCLRKEYASSGVTIQTLIPLMVNTKMAIGSKRSIIVPSPEAYSKSAVGTIGVADQTTGYWSHELQFYAFFKLCPDFLIDFIAGRASKDMRKVALAQRRTE